MKIEERSSHYKLPMAKQSRPPESCLSPAQEQALVKEVCRRIRVARSYWDAHNNAACRRERQRALDLYNTLSKSQKEQIPQVLRVWLRYRSEKYFGSHRTPPSASKGAKKGARSSSKQKKRRHRRFS